MVVLIINYKRLTVGAKGLRRVFPVEKIDDRRVYESAI